MGDTDKYITMLISCSHVLEQCKMIPQGPPINTTNQCIYCAVTGPLPFDAMARLPGKEAFKKFAQPERRGNYPCPRASISLAVLVLDNEDCKSIHGADMLLYNNGSDERQIIIFATSENLDILAEQGWIQELPVEGC